MLHTAHRAVFLILTFCTIAISASRTRTETLHQTAARSSFPFQAIGVYWATGAQADVRVRASQDRRKWTPWIEVQGETVDAGRTGSGLIYFGKEGYLFFEVEGVKDPDVMIIDPGSSPAQAPADSQSPAVVTREQWGCTSQTCPVRDAPLYTTVTHLIVHHTAGVNAATDWPAVVRSIWVLHVQGNGWNDIGYNYLIDPNGALYEGRAGGDGVLGAHFSGVNGGTMGVALLGTYIDIPPPAPMMETLKSTLAWQASKWHLDPTDENLHAASGLVLPVISGHRDAGISPKATSTTECPGNTAYSSLVEIRKEVLARIGACVLNIGERNRCVGAEGGLLGITERLVSSCQQTLNVKPAADWISEKLEVAPNLGARRTAIVPIGNLDLLVTQAGKGEPALPCLARAGIVNSADFDSRPVVAGSQISIFGENFGNNAKVAVNGKAVPVGFAGSNQINLYLPTSVKIGTNHMTVTVEGVTGPEVNFSVTEAMPAVYLSMNADDFTRNAPATPVKPGHALSVYLTGVGNVDSTALRNASYPWSATIGGMPASRLFLGSAPSLPGVYQANILVPETLGPGSYALAFKVNGVTSHEAMVEVAPN